MKSIPVLGETDGERNRFAMGYRLGMIRANEIMIEAAKEAGEVAGQSPMGPYRNAVNLISAEIPNGKVKITYTLEGNG